MDEGASAGEIACAVYALTFGENAEPDVAIAALASHGILPADFDAEPALTREAADGVLDAYADADEASAAGALGWALENGVLPEAEADGATACAPGAEMTRGDLAEALFDYYGMLEG